jgi:purine nucleosidase
MAIALEPEIVTRSEMRYVQVELLGAHTRGQTTVDWHNLTKQEPNVDVVLELNRERFWELFLAGVQ